MHIAVLAGARDGATSALLLRQTASCADRVSVIRVTPSAAATLQRATQMLQKIRKRGAGWLWTKLRYRGVEARLREEFDQAVAAALAGHPLWEISPNIESEHSVPTLNGPQMVSILKQLAPDLALQNGAGILREQVFTIPRLGTWNVHHGYLPAIRGGDSVLWALLEGRPDWVGCSLHMIDRGIDTGNVIARRKIPYAHGEHPGLISARITEAALELLRDALATVGRGSPVPRLELPPEEAHLTGAYRSFVDGRALAALWKSGFQPVNPRSL